LHSFRHIEFAQVNLDLQSEVGKVVELGEIQSEYTLFEGKELVLKKFNLDIFALIEDMVELVNQPIGNHEFCEAKKYFQNSSLKNALISFFFFGLSLTFHTVQKESIFKNKIWNFHNLSSCQPLYIERFVIERNSLYVPTGQTTQNIRIFKKDGSLDNWILGTEYF